MNDDVRYTYVQKDYEIVDIYMEMKIFFWDGGLTDNYLSVNFTREDINYLRNYLLLVMSKLKKDDECIVEMIKKEIILKYT